MDMPHLGKMQGLLAVLVVLGFFACIGALLFAPAPAPAMRDTLLVLTGGLGAAFSIVIQYYFGSSSGSRAKDSAIANSIPVPSRDNP